MSKSSSEFLKISIEAKKVIQKTEKALAKHIRLVKKGKHITSIVATIERLKGSLREEDAAAVNEWLARLNGLTEGFAKRALKR